MGGVPGSISRFSRAARSRGFFAVDLANGRVSLAGVGPARSETSGSASIRRSCLARLERARELRASFAAGKDPVAERRAAASALATVARRSKAFRTVRGVQQGKDPGVLDGEVPTSMGVDCQSPRHAHAGIAADSGHRPRSDFLGASADMVEEHRNSHEAQADFRWNVRLCDRRALQGRREPCRVERQPGSGVARAVQVSTRSKTTPLRSPRRSDGGTS